MVYAKEQARTPREMYNSDSDSFDEPEFLKRTSLNSLEQSPDSVASSLRRAAKKTSNIYQPRCYLRDDPNDSLNFDAPRFYDFNESRFTEKYDPDCTKWFEIRDGSPAVKRNLQPLVNDSTLLNLTHDASPELGSYMACDNDNMLDELFHTDMEMTRKATFDANIIQKAPFGSSIETLVEPLNNKSVSQAKLEAEEEEEKFNGSEEEAKKKREEEEEEGEEEENIGGEEEGEEVESDEENEEKEVEESEEEDSGKKVHENIESEVEEPEVIRGNHESYQHSYHFGYQETEYAGEEQFCAVDDEGNLKKEPLEESAIFNLVSSFGWNGVKHQPIASPILPPAQAYPEKKPASSMATSSVFRSTYRPLTIPKEFNFATSTRVERGKAGQKREIEKKKLSRPLGIRTPKAIQKRPVKLTVPKPFHFHSSTSHRSKAFAEAAQEIKSPFVPLAVRVQQFESKVLNRSKVKAESKQSAPLMSSLTLPQSPFLRTSKLRAKPKIAAALPPPPPPPPQRAPVQSAKALQEIKRTELTIPKSPQFLTRFRTRPISTITEKENKNTMFKAKPFDKKLFEKPKVVAPLQVTKPKLTIPQSPAFTKSRARAPQLSSSNTNPAPTHPASHREQAISTSLQSGHFLGQSISQLRRWEFEEKIRKENIEKKQAAKPKPTAKPKVTRPAPFRFQTDLRAERHQGRQQNAFQDKLELWRSKEKAEQLQELRSQEERRRKVEEEDRRWKMKRKLEEEKGKEEFRQLRQKLSHRTEPIYNAMKTSVITKSFR
ncbi:uncharacterized protein VTP21DRAFT_5610 [Calcarisporiella thermophila]|uniref:uncharacterized protein n=1 Tax=Calcarisporiella thermophila TaxID=911321 RepID=UPI003742ACAE